MDIADRNGVALRRLLLSAERLSELRFMKRRAGDESHVFWRYAVSIASARGPAAR